MIRGFAILLVCQLAGEIASRSLALPVPGAVLGMVLLVAGLGLRTRRGAVGGDGLDGSDLARVADGLLGALALLFVPAGVGVVQYLTLLEAHALALALALVGSTLVTLLVTVGVFLAVGRLRGGATGERA